MAEVIQRQRANGLSKLLPIAGQVIGTIYGGPTGGAIGSAAGGAIGSMTQKPQAQSIEAPQTSPMDRRMNQQKEDPLNVLGEAKQSLAYMPDDVKQKYQKPIDDAYALAVEQRRRSQQTGVA